MSDNVYELLSKYMRENDILIDPDSSIEHFSSCGDKVLVTTRDESCHYIDNHYIDILDIIAWVAEKSEVK